VGARGQVSEWRLGVPKARMSLNGPLEKMCVMDLEHRSLLCSESRAWARVIFPVAMPVRTPKNRRMQTKNDLSCEILCTPHGRGLNQRTEDAAEEHVRLGRLIVP